jgi:hypothetical protein
LWCLRECALSLCGYTAVSITCDQGVFLRIAHILHERDGANTAFDDDVRWSANHHQMLDIVTAHENETPPCIDGCRVQHLQARLAVSAATDERGRATASADEPQDDGKQQECRTHTNHCNDQAIAICANEIFHNGAGPFSHFVQRKCTRITFVHRT